MKAKGFQPALTQSIKHSASNSFHQNSTTMTKSVNRSQITINHNRSPSDMNAPDITKVLSDFNKYKPQTPSTVFKGVSYLSDETMDRLKKQLSDKEEEIVLHPSIKRKKPPGILLQASAAELQYQDLEKEENEKIRKNYEEYRKNFHRFVIDKDKNLIYTKPNPINIVPPEQELYQTLEKEFNDIEQKYKSSNAEKIFKKMLSTSVISSPKPDEKHYLRGSSHIENLKIRSQNFIDNQMQLMKNTKLAEEAKTEIEKIAKDSAEIIDKMGLENAALKAELDTFRAKCEELESHNGILIRKNQVLLNQIQNLKGNDETMRKNQQNFEALKKIYNALKEKFPDDDIKAIIGKYDNLQNYCVDYVKRINELELENKELLEEKHDYRKVLEKKDRQIKDEENKTQKLHYVHKQELENKEMERFEEKFFKDEYQKLFRGVTDLYLRWSEKIEMFDGKNQLNLKPNMNDPSDIVKILGKMIEVSTTEKLQKYIKKIIVSANLLLRKHFPDSVNEQFDPDKIYEKVNNYIEKLENELNRENKRTLTSKKSFTMNSPKSN